MLGKNIQFHPMGAYGIPTSCHLLGSSTNPLLGEAMTALQIWQRTTPWRRWTSCCGEPSCGAAMRRSLRQMTKKNTPELCFRIFTEKGKGHDILGTIFSIHDEITFWTLDPNPWFGLNGSSIEIRFMSLQRASGPSSKIVYSSAASQSLAGRSGSCGPTSLWEDLGRHKLSEKIHGKCHTGGNEGLELMGGKAPEGLNTSLNTLIMMLWKMIFLSKWGDLWVPC